VYHALNAMAQNGERRVVDKMFEILNLDLIKDNVCLEYSDLLVKWSKKVHAITHKHIQHTRLLLLGSFYRYNHMCWSLSALFESTGQLQNES